MENISPRQVVTVSLRYSSQAKPLRTIAVAELAAKVLFLASRSLRTRTVADQIAVSLGIQGVPVGQVAVGLAYLRETGKAITSDDSWSLTPQARSDVASNVEAFRAQLLAVLGRHFPHVASEESLADWFRDASCEVFGHFGDDWVASVSKGPVRRPWAQRPLKTILRPTFQNHHLTNHADALVEGYLRFLSSDTLSDQQCLMGLGQAMFSARLVAAGVGVDPFTLEEFRGATVFLDTNMLFAMALEDHRLSRSLGAIGQALQALRIKVGFLRPTRDEYLRVVSSKRDEILLLVDTYDADVVRHTRDDFIGTAVARGCKARDDFNRFFDSLRDLPEHLGPAPVALQEDEVIAGAIESSERDQPLRSQISSTSQTMMSRWRNRGPKGKLSLDHDAALLRVIETLRESSDKVWGVSLDRSLQAVASQRAGEHGLPTVVTADALIEILAVHAAGPTVDASDYAPLLARMILNQCEPPPETYTAQDLQWLTSINEEVARLTPDATKAIAQEVTRARINGARMEDPKLQVTVNRLFQVRREDEKRELSTAIARARGAEKDLLEERRARKVAEDHLADQFAGEIMRKALRSLIWELSWRLGAILGVTGAMVIAYRLLVPDGDRASVVEYAFMVGPTILWAATLLPKAIRKYRQCVAFAPSEARKRVQGQSTM